MDGDRMLSRAEFLEVMERDPDLKLGWQKSEIWVLRLRWMIQSEWWWRVGGRVVFFFFRYNGHMFYDESIQDYLLYFLVQLLLGINDQKKTSNFLRDTGVIRSNSWNQQGSWAFTTLALMNLGNSIARGVLMVSSDESLCLEQRCLLDFLKAGGIAQGLFLLNPVFLLFGS